ncbi:hypothetical protein J3D45_000662 [Microbacterium foliorum]|uniref:DUF2264 domain-containing protein n=1 Tax=Microbacterium foliorum TaxID=104336 RepID=UPI00209CF606|nr:DUF2264 domain-containing protein [Microbacterium foliorum]MCP1428164.1 hypothetical protein [Microbacterium foliorum]
MVVADWSREQWLALADRMLTSVEPWASPRFSRITLPGEPGGYGTDIDGLEGFARTFLLAGFRIAGANGRGVDRLISHYANGVRSGVDPADPDRWVRPDEHPQAKVEAASIALILDLTRPWIWDRLDVTTQSRVIDYFAPVVGDDTYPPTNWVWFRIVVQTFLRSVGGPWSATDIAADLARHDSLMRVDGWMSDGDERAFDHYVGWALHTYPVLWARMRGASELAHGREASDVAALDRYLVDAVALVGADGAPLFQGRSLIYRFAAAAPFWAGIIAGVPSTDAGTLRRAASAIVEHFVAHETPDSDGLLTLGWHGPWPALAQSYSGPASPYWAVKGLMGVMLPGDHPVWNAEARPLPIERGDELRVIVAAGWVVSGTRADGVVRIINHGTDHALSRESTGDSPLYARMAYSTATSPLLDSRAWREPVEQSVVLVDHEGRCTHRAAMRLLDIRVEFTPSGERIGVAGSIASAHWMRFDERQIGHGSGLVGEPTFVADITTWSVVRGEWEVRCVLVGAPAVEVRDERLALRVGGWALAGDAVDSLTGGGAASVFDGRLHSIVQALGRPVSSVVLERTDASPFGTRSFVPAVESGLCVGEWTITALSLRGSAGPAPDAQFIDERPAVSITWPDGTRSLTDLSLPPDHRYVVETPPVSGNPSSGSGAIAKEQHT